jgi:hypothetical protein
LKETKAGKQPGRKKGRKKERKKVKEETLCLEKVGTYLNAARPRRMKIFTWIPVSVTLDSGIYCFLRA